MKLANLKAKLPQLVVLLSIVALIGIRTAENGSDLKSKIASAPNTEVLFCLKSILPEAASIQDDGVEQWIIKDKNDGTIGKAVVAQQTTSKIIGYSGPVPIVIVLDKNDKVRCLGLLPNSETPSFIETVKNDGLLKRWEGLTAEQVVGKNMDAVSGATYSSTAINETVKQRLAEYSKTTAVAQKASMKKIISYGSILLVLLYALAFYCFPKPLSKYRITLIVLSVGVLGVAYGSFLSIKLIGGWFIQGISLKNQIIFLTLAALAILLPFSSGKTSTAPTCAPLAHRRSCWARLTPRSWSCPKA